MLAGWLTRNVILALSNLIVAFERNSLAAWYPR